MKKQITKSQKPMQKSQSQREQGLNVSQRVKIQDVRLINAKSKIEPAALRGKKEFDITYKTRCDVPEKSNLILVFANFAFKGFREGKKEKPVIIIEAEFLLAYTISSLEGITEQDIKFFADLNGVFNAWPYWREFVQNTIARMNLPTLTIPVFRIVAPPKPKKTKKKAVVKKKASPKKKTIQKV